MIVSRPKTVMNHGIPAAGRWPSRAVRCGSAAPRDRRRTGENEVARGRPSSRGAAAPGAARRRASRARARARRRSAARPARRDSSPSSGGTTSTRSSQRSRGSSSTRTDVEPSTVPALGEEHLRAAGSPSRRRGRTGCSSPSKRGRRAAAAAGVLGVAEREVVLLDREDVREVAAELERELEGDASPYAGSWTTIRSCIASPTKRARAIESASCGSPSGERVAEVEGGREVLDLAGGESSGRRAVDRQPQAREEARVCDEEAGVGAVDVPALVADAERRAFEDRERHGGASRRMRAARGLCI